MRLYIGACSCFCGQHNLFDTGGCSGRGRHDGIHAVCGYCLSAFTAVFMYGKRTEVKAVAGSNVHACFVQREHFLVSANVQSVDFESVTLRRFTFCIWLTLLDSSSALSSVFTPVNSQPLPIACRLVKITLRSTLENNGCHYNVGTSLRLPKYMYKYKTN